MKAAIIHDWLFGMRGGEKCLEELCRLLPDARIFSLFYEQEGISELVRSFNPRASFLQALPQVHKYYRHLLPFYPAAAIDLGRKIARANCDLVISISHCAAKNVPVPPGVPHLCYCLTPMRYIWDQYDAYFSESRLEPLIRQVAKPLRRWDVHCAGRITEFIAISDFVRSRIGTVYGCESSVIYPPVRKDWITPREEGEPGEAFLSVSALVPYKNVDVLVRAFNQSGLPLKIVGTGPEESKLRRIAGENIEFLGWVNESQLAELYRRSRALVFAAEEDFGISPVEMQAAGRPVVAWGRGGVLETVSVGQEKPSGIFFTELSPSAVLQAVEEFVRREPEFTAVNCMESADRFSVKRFTEAFAELLDRTANEKQGRSKGDSFVIGDHR